MESGEESHKMGNWTEKSDDDIKHYKYCKCGFSQVDYHNFLPGKFDATGTNCIGGTWVQICQDCWHYKNTFLNAHTGGTATCTYGKICTRCNTEYTSKIGHTYSNNCDTSCNNNCGATRSTSHTYSNNCDTSCNECGATRSTSHAYSNNCDTSCNECGSTRSTSHTYSNNCDTSCNVCGATRSTSHTYLNNCDTSCNVCGATRSISHTYSNKCDTSCNVCGATRSTSHTYSNACDSSCDECGATRSTSHTYSNKCDTSCNVCGATRSTSHTYSNTCDASCNVCGASRSVTHSYTIAATCTTAKKCSICSATTGSPLGHSYGSWSAVNGSYHKRNCTRAGCSSNETGSHYLGSNRLNCGACGLSGPFSSTQSVKPVIY